ncbi:MAG: Hsp20 family protein [Alphaproteobacteria bacterium]
MNNLDFPFSRYSVGFDRLFRLLDATATGERNAGYPPYNIEETDENSWAITLAVAGFTKDDIEITEEQGLLRIKATNNISADDTERRWVHRGIASRSFERRFNLASHIKVKKASLENGLLNIELEREVPEILKPKQIQISDQQTEEKLIEDHAVA